MRFVVIMDPVVTVKVDGDTSFALMEEAQRRGHRVDHCLNTDLYLDGSKLYARVAQATMQRPSSAEQPSALRTGTAPIMLAAPEEVCLHDVDAILVRTDPPFDDNYLWATLLLEHVKRDTLVVNDPHGLRRANEKLYATHFPELMPETIITSHKDRIKAFVTRVGGHAVIKPLGGMGGAGVMVLKNGDQNINAIIESTTMEGRHVVMVQKFLPEISVGDKRILVLDGEPLGALLRVPASDDMRSNLRVGGKGVKTAIDEHEKKIIAKLAPSLRNDGLMFVGIDVIGGRLTEVNVTSPTGIQAMNRLDGFNYCAPVIEWIEKRVASGVPAITSS